MFGRSSRRESTAGHYPASGRYQATKACLYVSIATSLDTVTRREVRVLERSTGHVNNKGFGVYFSYTKLNFVIFNSDIVILG